MVLFLFSHEVCHEPDSVQMLSTPIMDNFVAILQATKLLGRATPDAFWALFCPVAQSEKKIEPSPALLSSTDLWESLLSSRDSHKSML